VENTPHPGRVTPMAEDDNGNGRITLAVLGAKLDRLIDDVAEIRHGQDGLIKQCAAHEERITDNTDEIDRLRNVSTGWSAINSLGAIVAVVFGLKQ